MSVTFTNPLYYGDKNYNFLSATILLLKIMIKLNCYNLWNINTLSKNRYLVSLFTITVIIFLPLLQWVLEVFRDHVIFVIDPTHLQNMMIHEINVLTFSLKFVKNAVNVGTDSLAIGLKANNFSKCGVATKRLFSKQSARTVHAILSYTRITEWILLRIMLDRLNFAIDNGTSGYPQY